MEDTNKSVPTPYITPDNNEVLITKADMENIRTMLKAKAVVIIATSTDETEPCNPDDCTGHWVIARSIGFHEQRLWSMGPMLMSDHIHNETCGDTPSEMDK
jgi:hypothetical protein